MFGLYGYDNEITSGKELELEDAGNCCLEATTKSGYAFYLIVLTDYGTTSIVNIGPVFIGDNKLLPNKYKCDYQRFQFKEHKINQAINKFLSQRVKLDKHRSEGIDFAHEIDLKDALDAIVDMPLYIISRDDEAY